MQDVIWRLHAEELYWLNNEMQMATWDKPVNSEDSERIGAVKLASKITDSFNSLDFFVGEETLEVRLHPVVAKVVLAELGRAPMRFSEDGNNEERLAEVGMLNERLRAEWRALSGS